jgi:hypothetical protein
MQDGNYGDSGSLNGQLSRDFRLCKTTFSGRTLCRWYCFVRPLLSQTIRAYDEFLSALSLQEENPGISLTDQSKKAGEIWREMGESDKKEWEKKTKEAKEAYDIEYKEWLESGGAEAIKQVFFTRLLRPAFDRMRRR